MKITKFLLLSSILFSLLNCNPKKEDSTKDFFLYYLILRPPYESTAVVTTLAGSTAGTSGFQDGMTTDARFNLPYDIRVDNSGNLFIADKSNNVIRKINSTGDVSTYAGSIAGISGYVEASSLSSARFLSPQALAIDNASGTIYVLDQVNRAVRKLTSAGVVSTLAGGNTNGYVNGTGGAAKFSFELGGITIDGSSDLLIADHNNSAIRKVISTSAFTTTLAGALPTVSGLGTTGYIDDTGTAARFSRPTGIAKDSNGNFYLVDAENYNIRKVTNVGVTTTFAGSTLGGFSASGYQDGIGTNAKFVSPIGITADSSDNLFITDSGCIRKITSAAVVTTIAGICNSNSRAFVDGTGANARFKGPLGITVDINGVIYVADTENNAIRKIVQK